MSNATKQHHVSNAHVNGTMKQVYDTAILIKHSTTAFFLSSQNPNFSVYFYLSRLLHHSSSIAFLSHLLNHPRRKMARPPGLTFLQRYFTQTLVSLPHLSSSTKSFRRTNPTLSNQNHTPPPAHIAQLDPLTTTTTTNPPTHPTNQ